MSANVLETSCCSKKVLKGQHDTHRDKDPREGNTLDPCRNCIATSANVSLECIFGQQARSSRGCNVGFLVYSDEKPPLTARRRYGLPKIAAAPIPVLDPLELTCRIAIAHDDGMHWNMLL